MVLQENQRLENHINWKPLTLARLVVFQIFKSNKLNHKNLQRKMSLFQSIAILFILVLNFSTVHNRKITTLSQLTSDIIENERVPSILYAKACWPKVEEIAFVKSFSIPIQFDDSITPINLRIDENTNKQWFFIDMNCKQYSNFLSSVDEKYFAHPYRWIIVDAKNESIQHLNLLPDSNIILADRKTNSEHFTLNQGCVIY